MRMEALGPIRRIIDRDWIKVDWCGSQTLVHRLIAVAPLLLCGVLGGLVPSYRVGVVVGVIGVLATAATTMWIEGRRLIGTGAFSSRRSANFVRRIRRARKSDGEDAGEQA